MGGITPRTAQGEAQYSPLIPSGDLEPARRDHVSCGCGMERSAALLPPEITKPYRSRRPSKMLKTRRTERESARPEDGAEARADDLALHCAEVHLRSLVRRIYAIDRLFQDGAGARAAQVPGNRPGMGVWRA